jgi:hypothetical protein
MSEQNLSAMSPELNIPINGYELIFVIEAVHDSIIQRLWLATSSDHREMRPVVDVGAVKRSLGALMAIYGRAWQQYADLAVPADETMPSGQVWEAEYGIPDDVWEAITNVIASETWDEVRYHEYWTHDNCNLCDKIHAATAAFQ